MDSVFNEHKGLKQVFVFRKDTMELLTTFIVHKDATDNQITNAWTDHVQRDPDVEVYLEVLCV